MNTLRFNLPARAFRLFTLTALIGLTGTMLQPVHAAPGPNSSMGPQGDMAGTGGRGAGMDGPGHMGQMGRMGDMADMGPMGHMGRMLDSVNASADQKAQIKTIMGAARSELMPLHAQMKSLREETAALFTQTTVDANAVEAARLQMHALHGQVSQRMAQAMIDSSRVLTPEQRAKMADMMSKRRAMAERHRAEAESLTGKPAGVK